LFNLLGVCLCELKDFLNAEKALEEACKMEAGNEEFQFNLLLCLSKKGNTERAKAMYTAMGRSCNNQTVRDKLLTLRNSL
jgi:Flp pilus assembly protein TadD